MKPRKLFFAFLFWLLPSLAFAGSAYYVDLDAVINGNGTFTSPWNNLNSVNSHNFSTGDDVYLKAGTTSSGSETLTIDWGGTSADSVIIGCYYDDGGFPCTDCSGQTLPAIDGNHTVPETAYRGLIYSYGKAYLNIKDLRLKDSKYIGIYIRYAENCIVQNCYIYHSKNNGILIGRSGSNIIKDNTIERAIYTLDSGAAIELSHSPNNTVQRNVIIDSDNEGIGVYFQESTGNIIEYNEIYNADSFHIYLDGASNNTVRYNLVYDTDDGLFGSYGIVVDIEKNIHPSCTTGSNEIYGNLISGVTRGITLACEAGQYNLPGCGQTNNKIYTNTIVDCEKNYTFFDPTSAWSGNEIKNNISWTITPGDSVHSNNYSPTGVFWSHNIFDDSVSGNAGNNAVIGDPKLVRTQNWRSLPAGNVDWTEWSLQSDSPATNTGASLAGYNDRISDVSRVGDLLRVTIASDSTPNIGAWIEGGHEPVSSPAPPSNLTIVTEQ